MKLGSAVFVAILLLAASVHGTILPISTIQAEATAYQPSQFITKLYTEGFGRLPNVSEWNYWHTYFNNSGCTAATMTVAVKTIYNYSGSLPAEFDTDYPAGPDASGGYNSVRVLTLYRGALSSDPNQTDESTYTGSLNAGTLTWPGLINAVTTSSAFSSYASVACGSNPNAGFGTTTAPTLPPHGTGIWNTTGSNLQAQLNSAASTCGTVTIAQAALISLAPGGNTPAGTVSVPACVTLTTYAAPANGQYGLMGRLIRSAFFASEMVAIQPGGKVLNVWIDGQRGSPSTLLVDSAGMHNGQDVVAYSGANTTLSNSRIANSYGPQAVLFHGEQDIPGGGAACSANVIQNNVVTAYSSDYFHYVAATATTSNPSAAPYAEWEDGIDTACKATTISGNAVVDATDVSIGTFMAYPNTQASHVTSNTVLQAGNSTHAMLSADPLNPTGGPTDDFTGFVASQNHLWTSPYAHADFGVTLGTKAWFAGGSGSVGNGATVTNNDENGSVARVRIGIGVDGMNFPCVGCGTGGSGLNVMSGFQLVNPWPTSDPDVRAHGCSSGSAAAIAVDQTYTSYTANIQTPWIAENSSGGSGQLIGCETPLLWYANSNCSGYTGTCFTVSGSSSWRALPIFY